MKRPCSLNYFKGFPCSDHFFNLINETNSALPAHLLSSARLIDATEYISSQIHFKIGTVKSRVLTHVYNMEINFFTKGHSKQTSNFPFIDILKKPPCASKQDGLVLGTLRYAYV